MRKCSNCYTDLAKGAKFCHECGTKAPEEVLTCQNCGTENPSGAKFCKNCGFNFAEKNSLNELFEEAPTAELETEIRQRFKEHLRFKIQEELTPEDIDVYFKRLNTSDFRISLDIKVKHLAEDIAEQQQKPDFKAENTRKFLSKTFSDLSDFFIIYYCSDLNSIELSEKILHWRDANLQNVDMLQMSLDYLNFSQEEDVTYYTNFIEMPIDRLKRAGKSFLFPEKDEKIYLICDQSVLGSLKEGFAITEKAIYWRMHFEPARKVLFKHLKEVKKEKDWLTINEKFFHAGNSLNVKMLKLLKKIKQL